MSTPATRVPAPALVLGAIVSVQCGSAVAARLFDRIDPTTVVFFRLALSALLLCVVVRPRVWRWSRAQVGAAAGLAVAMSCMNLVFYEALEHIDLGVGVTVEFVGPLLLALVQTRRSRDAAFALLAAAGVGLLGLSGTGDVSLLGLLLAFVAGLFWAVYIVASARVGALLPGTQGLAVSLTLGAVVAGLVTSFRSPGQIGTTLGSSTLLWHAVGVALLSSVVPYSLELAALRTLPTRVFGILMSLEPVSATLAGLAILGQRISVLESVALILVSFASLGITLGARPARPAAQTPAPVPTLSEP